MSFRKLYHYSPTRFFSIDTTRWQKPASHCKPKGIWLSDDDGDRENSWREWCLTENFRLDNLRYRYAATFAPHAKILLLKNAEEIDNFTTIYGMSTPIAGAYLYVDWTSVALGYQGIVISPYCRARRLSWDTSWYYSWDCASGCVWDISAFSDFTFDETYENLPRLKYT